MIRKIASLVLLIFAVTSTINVTAQEDWKILVGADYDMYFDNRELIDCRFGESQTIFSSRLTPKIGVAWDEKNSLVAGVDLWSDFGNNNVTFAKVRPQIYYQFKIKRVYATRLINANPNNRGFVSEIMISNVGNL